VWLPLLLVAGVLCLAAGGAVLALMVFLLVGRDSRPPQDRE
jgi:hypothetical protein